MTPHIEAIKEDIANVVIMPGDPKRAEAIAKTFLTDYKLVNTVRGMLAFTGLYKDKLVTIMASGMGNASMGIYSYELFKYYDVDYIIRVGTAGSFDESLQVRELFLVDSCFSDSSYAKVAYDYNSNVIESSTLLNNIIKNKANYLGQNIKEGRVYSTDVFYAMTDANDIAISNNCLSVEMETWALLNNAKYFNKQATSLLTITNTFYNDEELTPEERQNNFNDIVKVALESALDV